MRLREQKRVRRAVLAGLFGAALSTASASPAEQTLWRFDNLKRIGGFPVKIDGHPHIVKSPSGKAIRFDGKGDSIFIAGRPLVGATIFTIEAIFKPEGGAFEQRFMHIAETDTGTGSDAFSGGTGDSNARFMFEVRVVNGCWYLDTYVKSKAGGQALAFKEKRYPVGRWYAVAQSYDGKTYRAYVNGVLQGEADLAFAPHGPGHVRVGARMNRVNYFAGSVAEARFTDRALPPGELLRAGK